MPMLLPSWMDPEALIRFFGPYALWGVAFVVFAECGIFAILPGDSLLFTVGLLVAADVIPYNLVFVCIVLTIAAVLGNVSGYAIGRKVGLVDGSRFTSGDSCSTNRYSTTMFQYDGKPVQKWSLVFAFRWLKP